MLEIGNPQTRIIPCLIVQCPFDASVKSMLLEILRKSDELLETNYFENALKARATTDVLIGIVSQVALQHVGTVSYTHLDVYKRQQNGFTCLQKVMPI